MNAQGGCQVNKEKGARVVSNSMNRIPNANLARSALDIEVDLALGVIIFDLIADHKLRFSSRSC